VDEPNTKLSSIVGNFFGNLQKYQHNELLQDLVVPVMSIKEFWQHDDKDYIEFEYRKSLVPKQVHVKLPFIMMRFHEWYYLTCIYGLNFIEAKILGDIFKTSDFDLHVQLAELHTTIVSKCSTSL
jgi:hypothetical protein